MNQYKEIKEILCKCCGEENVIAEAPMKEHTHFRVGGPVDLLVTPSTKEQVGEVVSVCKERNVPYFILGNGSNILVKDGGISGVVIKLEKIDNIEVNGDEVTADCGALLSKVSKAALDAKLTGLEFACGIPGSIGGAVFMNAGAYNGEMADVIKEVSAIDSEGNVVNLTLEELQLGYRTSLIMTDGYVVLSATLKLEKVSDENVNKIEDRMNDLTRRREERQPLEYASAGSTFKRPEGYFAGKLIQDSDLKGFSIGGAAVSEKHSGFVINKGNATAKDVLDVIAHVQKTVKEKFGVDLHTEVRIIGKDK
ncbi:UDP-N-acetylmuramate dehydrogenase [Clostridium massiliamazoniense]|uniref:UDP-N-acetylmuramate dehydrogenase n=1 Tax=Clostridium massiliamazoniense TaxID=1347366 RepID=UPI0006D7BA78|nr:UDP-N-acetylmuramate dehydrogenase [Clostridium massiliamazoniense]